MAITASEIVRESNMTFEELYASLVEVHRNEKPGDSFTVEKFCADAGIMARTTGVTRLKQLVKEGVLETGYFIEGGHRRAWYRFVRVNET